MSVLVVAAAGSILSLVSLPVSKLRCYGDAS